MNIMTIKTAGETAKGGFYFDLKTWELHLHRRNGETLPGNDSDRYVRIPTVALLVLGPAMGFLFVIFLPALGFALAIRELGRKIAAGIGRSGRTAKEAKNEAR
jgi:hypothetical protein